MTKYDNILKLGFIQTNIDNDVAWGPESNISLNIKEESQYIVWEQIRKGFHKLHNSNETPDIIIMPELNLPLGYKAKLKRLSIKINSAVLTGLDYIVDKNKIYNKAILYVPNKFSEKSKSQTAKEYLLGKKFQANMEKISLKNYNEQKGEEITFVSEENIYIIETEKFGNIGFAICADFYDLDRFVAYKGKVQHIFIIAYNKDTNSFQALAESISRLVFCNVVICNTGKFGDSMVFSPYKDSFKRFIYRHKGANLFTTQIVHLPVKSVYDDQKIVSDNDDSSNTRFFKSPPSYKLNSETNKTTDIKF